MRRLFTLAVLLALVAVAAVATRPGPAQFDAMLRGAIADKLAQGDSPGGDPGMTLALAACRLRPGDCFAVLRATLDVHFDQGLFFTTATVRGLTEATCTGAFTRFYCTKDILAP